MQKEVVLTQLDAGTHRELHYNGRTRYNGLESFIVSPNPTDGLINIKIKLNQAKKVSFVIIDVPGREIHTSLPQNMSGTVTKQISINAEAGIYFLRTFFGSQILILIVVENRSFP